jgi:MHS family shikimate/dehydroshikimate transporter-like MFS transporter
LLGNKVGARQGYLVALIICIAVSFVFFPMQDTRDPTWIYTARILAVGIGVASLIALQGAYFSACFSTSVRTSGFVLGREVSVALGGGLSPLIATLLFSWGGSSAVTAFAVILGVASLLTVLLSSAGRQPDMGGS